MLAMRARIGWIGGAGLDAVPRARAEYVSRGALGDIGEIGAIARRISNGSTSVSIVGHMRSNRQTSGGLREIAMDLASPRGSDGSTMDPPSPGRAASRRVRRVT